MVNLHFCQKKIQLQNECYPICLGCLLFFYESLCIECFLRLIVIWGALTVSRFSAHGELFSLQLCSMWKHIFFVPETILVQAKRVRLKEELLSVGWQSVKASPKREQAGSKEQKRIYKMNKEADRQRLKQNMWSQVNERVWPHLHGPSVCACIKSKVILFTFIYIEPHVCISASQITKLHVNRCWHYYSTDRQWQCTWSCFVTVKK